MVTDDSGRFHVGWARRILEDEFPGAPLSGFYNIILARTMSSRNVLMDIEARGSARVSGESSGADSPN